MSTRGCVGWTLDGSEYVETYNHYDSYLEGLGCAMIEAIKGIDINKLKDGIEKCTNVKDSRKKASVTAIKRYGNKWRENPNNEEDITWYWLLRGVQGAGLLTAIANDGLRHVLVSKGWLDDSLFCEYAYTLNFKTNQLEFWEGFQKSDTIDRYGEREYGRCKIVGRISFDDIKMNTVEDTMKKAETFYPKD